VTTQRFLQEVSREVSTTTPFIEGMTLEFIHHTAGERHVDALRAGGIRHRSTGWRRRYLSETMLQLMDEILKKWHDFAYKYSRY
jgi:hypothetical protein